MQVDQSKREELVDLNGRTYKVGLEGTSGYVLAKVNRMGVIYWKGVSSERIAAAARAAALAKRGA